MSLDFFCPQCQEPPLSEKLFGLCDDEQGDRAYTCIDNSNKWIATIQNPNNITLTFTAIDKCVLKDEDFPKRGRCDGMLTSESHLYLVELKNKRRDWISDGKEQLISTIMFLKENHPEQLRKFRKKKAFVCNRKNPHFQTIDAPEKKRFRDQYGFILDIQAKINIQS